MGLKYKTFSSWVLLLPAWAVALLGVVFCAVIVGIPEIFPTIFGRDGYIWVPFASPNYRFGDSYFYAPWVREIFDGNFPPTSPIALENIDVYGIDTIRSLPSLIAAAISPLTNDFRFVLGFGFVISSSLFFVMAFSIANLFLFNPWRSLIVAFTTLFYGSFWVRFPASPVIIGDGSILAYIGSIYSRMQYPFVNLIDVREYELISDIFRYLNLSTSYLAFLAYMLMLMWLLRKPSAIPTLGVFLIGVALLFSYPSHPVLAYLVLLAWGAVLLWRRSWKSMAYVAASGIAILAFIFSAQIPSMIEGAYANSFIFTELYAANSIGLKEKFGIVDIFFVVVFNKYMATLLIARALTRSNEQLRTWITITGSIVCFFPILYLTDASWMASRFLNRGIDFFWFLLVLTALALWREQANKTAKETANKTAEETTGMGWGEALFIDIIGSRTSLSYNHIKTIGILLLIAIPVAGFTSYGIRNIHNEARFMDTRQWSAYQWIDENLSPRSAVIALDWEDISHIPIFTKSDLVYGHVDLSGRKPKEEITRFLGVWKILGRSREELVRILMQSVAAERKRRRGNSKSPPFVTHDEFQSARIFGGMAYFPYTKKIDGISIELEVGQINPEIVKWALSVYDGLDINSFKKGTRMEYILLPPDLWPLMEGGGQSGHTIVYDGQVRRVYRLSF